MGVDKGWWVVFGFFPLFLFVLAFSSSLYTSCILSGNLLVFILLDITISYS